MTDQPTHLPDERNLAARLMGQVRSEAKAQAARRNGKRGGRPKRLPATEKTRIQVSEPNERNPEEPPSQTTG